LSAITQAQVLETIRGICLALPGTVETVSHGHPAFATKKGIYAVLEVYSGELSLCVCVGKEMQGVFLKDPRFYRTPYIGHKGWVSLKVNAASLKRKEIPGLLAGSHARVL
jgi:predicted DNA-binding protein (MmcQ/YjbR family)